jgi:hypothetical protein
MNAKIARLAIGRVTIGLLTLGLLVITPALAQQSNAATPSAAPRKAVASKNTASSKSSHAALPGALAAIPEAARLAIEGDLVWLGSFAGLSAEEFDGHMLDSLKAFQRRNNGKDTGVLSDQERALLADAAKSRQAAVGWRLIDDSATGARVGVPEKLVPHTGPARTGSRWTSAQGQIQIETFRLHEASLPALFEQEKKTSQRGVHSSALNPDSFVIVGEQHLKKFIVRAQSRGSEVRGVTILYDQATEGTMAAVAVAVSDTFVGFPDPNTAVPAGRKRGVEYGSAVVVTSGGDLIAAADMTDECQSITVPGFGHADPIATDRTDNLTLLRLYGARDLVAAPLGGDAASGSDLTLFGIADPLAQAGDGAVTEAPARLTAQTMTPAPPGFGGAAAIDAQGRFAGIVALQSPLVASAGSVTPQAALVPAATVRAFLDAHGLHNDGVALAAGNAADPGAFERSVVRLICVRK